MVELRIKSKVGPKGQVVIPYAIRQIHKIRPNSEVFFEHKNNQIIIEASGEDPIQVFERFANSIKKPIKFNWKEQKEERMKEYWAKKLKK